MNATLPRRMGESSVRPSPAAGPGFAIVYVALCPSVCTMLCVPSEMGTSSIVSAGVGWQGAWYCSSQHHIDWTASEARGQDPPP